jgi:hypothetical protein
VLRLKKIKKLLGYRLMMQKSWSEFFIHSDRVRSLDRSVEWRDINLCSSTPFTNPTGGFSDVSGADFFILRGVAAMGRLVRAQKFG